MLKEMEKEQPIVFNGIFELEEKLNDARLDLMVKRGIGSTLMGLQNTCLSMNFPGSSLK